MLVDGPLADRMVVHDEAEEVLTHRVLGDARTKPAYGGSSCEAAPVQRTLAVLRALAVGFLSVVLCGCSDSASNEARPATEQELDGRSFSFSNITFEGEPLALAQPPSGEPQSISFGRTLVVQAACNTFGGTWSLDAGHLIVLNGGGSTAGCLDPADQIVLQALTAQPKVLLEGEVLIIEGESLRIEGHPAQ